MDRIKYLIELIVWTENVIACHMRPCVSLLFVAYIFALILSFLHTKLATTFINKQSAVHTIYKNDYRTTHAPTP